MANDKRTRQLFALLRKAGPIMLDRDKRLALFRFILWRNNVNSTNDLAPHEIEALVTQLNIWDGAGVLAGEVAKAVESQLCAESAP
jgi:hypothetical protein